MFKICHYQLRKRKLCLFEQDYFEKRPVHHYKPTIHNRRSSCPEVFFQKGILRNFAKFPGEHLCQSLFFKKVVGLSLATLSKTRLWHRCFPVSSAKFLRTPFFIEHLWWLRL